MRARMGMVVAGGMVGLAASTALAGQYVVTTITAPGLTSGSANGVNDLGVVVGSATISGVQSGFIWENGRLSVINGSLDGRSVSTELRSINNKGEAVGDVCTTFGQKAQFCKPIIVRSGNVTQPPVFGKGTHATFNFVNTAGQIAGQGGTQSFDIPFIFKPGVPLQELSPSLNSSFVAYMNKHWGRGWLRQRAAGSRRCRRLSL